MEMQETIENLPKKSQKFEHNGLERWYVKEKGHIHKLKYGVIREESTPENIVKKYRVVGKWKIGDFKSGKVKHDGITRHRLKEIQKEVRE